MASQSESTSPPFCISLARISQTSIWDQTKQAKLNCSSTNQWIGPVYSLGQAVGGLLAALTLDLLGRKKCLWAGCIMMILSTILLIDSGSLAMVLAARVLEGVSIGFLLLGYQVCTVSVDDVRTGKESGLGRS